jgi:hypothetical protein
MLCNYANLEMCLMDPGTPAPLNGQQIRVRNWFPDPHEEWTEVSWMNTNFSFAQLVNGAGNNQCLGVAGGNMNDGTAVISWNCNNNLASADQAWHAVLATYYVIDSVNQYPCYYFIDEPTAKWPTPRVFGVKGGNVVYDAPVILWDYISSAPDQLWCVIND